MKIRDVYKKFPGTGLGLQTQEGDGALHVALKLLA